MKELLQSWLEARLSVPGMIVCGLASADGADACRSADENVSPDLMAHLFSLVQNLGSLPGVEQPAVRWHTWVFANGKVRTATRADGWTFAAAVRANSDAAQILDPLTEEFLALKPSN
jgi:hypothetical protein